MTSPQIEGGRSDQAGSRSNRSRRFPRAQGERGAALVEFAIILPVLAMLLTGLFTGAHAYNQKLDVTHAAREGARYGATIPSTQTFSAGYTAPDPNTWAYGVQQYIVEHSNDSLVKSQVCVSLVQGATPSVVGTHTTKSGGGPCLTTDPYPSYHATNDPGRRVQVFISRPGKIDLAVFPSINFTMKSSAVAKSETKL